MATKRKRRGRGEGRGGQGRKDPWEFKFLPLLKQTGVMCIYAVHACSTSSGVAFLEQ